MLSPKHVVARHQRLWGTQSTSSAIFRSLASLGKTANDAVHQFDPTVVKGSDENLSDKDENGDSDEEDDQVDERHEMTNTQTVLELIHQVNAWRRFEGPES